VSRRRTPHHGVINPRKRFGQHFLEPAWVAKVVDRIRPAEGDVFLEIGPGRGALTHPLSARARRVVAFEIDRDLAAHLRAEALPNVSVVEGDFLEATAGSILDATGPVTGLRVAGNLPYNVGSPILFHLMALARDGLPVVDAVVMLQREVADRLTAAPGTPDYGVLTILIGRRAYAERVLSLPPGAFRPPPRVQSALVSLRFHAPEPPALDEAGLTAMVQAIFTRRRKMLSNALVAYSPAASFGPLEALEAAGLDPRRRPETLRPAEVVALADVLSRGK
jgi:16S rRNA (adenine1518-N6/adenine1519-N6)-dimethyltransferase